MTGFNIGIGKLGRVLIIKVEPGLDLLSTILVVIEKECINNGLILSAVGSLRKATLRNLKVFPEHFPITDKYRLFKVIEGQPLEITSLTGNISRKADGEVIIHAHITVSSIKSGEVVAMGGHLVEGNITYVMTEIAIAELEGVKLQRILHPERKSWELTFG